MSIVRINSLGITYPISFSAGTASLPSITFSGDPNTGVFAPAADTIAFTEGGTEGMRMTSAGELLVGMTTYGVTNSGASISPTASSSFYVSGGTVLTIGRGVSDGTAIQFNRSGTNCGSISVTSSSTAYNTSSDYRLKENVNYNFDATTRLKQLKPARFNFIIEPNKTVDGFIAHEVQSVIPEAIIGTKDEIDFEGKPVYQGIDQSKLTPILTKALQEAIAKIEQLEATNTSQQTKIDSLEARLTALES